MRDAGQSKNPHRRLAKEILSVLDKYSINMIFLAGYMRMLHISILEKYNNRIFNIHPSLLPKFGGKGMYGINVHTAVIAAKEKETGITIHRVNAEYDNGEIVAQTKVSVYENDMRQPQSSSYSSHKLHGQSFSLS